jgi:hypothetical protein
MPKASINIDSISSEVLKLKDSIKIKDKSALLLNAEINELSYTIGVLKSRSFKIKYKYDTLRIIDDSSNALVACDEYILVNENLKKNYEASIASFIKLNEKYSEIFDLKDSIITSDDMIISSLQEGNKRLLSMRPEQKRALWADAGYVYQQNLSAIKIGLTYYTKRKTGYSVFALTNKQGIGYGVSLSTKIF